MKVYVLDRYFPTGVELLQQHTEVVLWDDPERDRWTEDADGIMIRLFQVTSEHLARAKRLRVVAKQGVGVENIDLDAAKQHGITVFNTPGVNAEAVAELALSLALGVARRLGEFDRHIRGGEVLDRSDHLGTSFWQKSIGIVGMGHIGTRVARKWRGAFDARIVAYDPYAPMDAWADLPHSRAQSLEELLPDVDVLSLHLPLTTETRHLIAGRELARMRPSSILINVSRGGIVDEVALHRAITQGRLFGAGLDAFEQEPPTADNPLVTLPTVLSTPHAGGGTVENQSNSSLTVARQLLAVLDGQEPDNRVV